jgi:protein-disulfide isomerase
MKEKIVRPKTEDNGNQVVQSMETAIARSVPVRRDTGLILAIIFASVVISGSLVYFGMQMSGKGNANVTVEMLEQAFDAYVQKQQNKQLQDQQKAQDEQDKADQAKAVNVKKVTADDHIFGNKDAKVSLVEYSDFECPFCKVFDSIGNQLINDYNGQLNWVYRHYPLSFHDPMATFEAEVSECVADEGGNDKFWAYVSAVYAKTKSGGKGLSEDEVYAIVRSIGLNDNVVKSCVKSGKFADKIKQDIVDGETAGVSGTPGNILINNQTGAVKAVHGARDVSVFKAAIDELLK